MNSQEIMMSSFTDPPGFDESTWIADQISRYGPVLGGEVLRQFLGFRTAAAFQKARYLDAVEVSLFALPGRQGLFALTQEACEWLIQQRRSAQHIRPDTEQLGTSQL
ncbi:hypothetical protein [Xanthomonas tesorieronis]|uniref:hypothetical protein n=1 Tax=Xanthomonas tesorieronis TaxID=3160839 RepID=UPI0035190E80